MNRIRGKLVSLAWCLRFSTKCRVMNKRNIIIVFLLGLLINSGTLLAQNNNPRRQNLRGPSLSVGFQIVQPNGDFKNYYDGNPVGIGGAFLINGGRSPFSFGVGYSWQSMGKNDESIRVLEGEDINGNPVYGSGQMSVNSNIYTYHTMARFNPLAGKVQPYIDAIAGFKSFTTKTTVTADNGSYSEVVSEDREAKDVAASYGWAAGLKLEVTGGIMVEGRVESLLGGQTTFVDPESILIDKDGNLSYDSIQSKTNVTVFQLGISFEF